MKTLIVGSHFKPPAKQLLGAVPPGLPLELRPNPENPYDENAIEVRLDFADIPQSSYGRLEAELEGTGFDVETLSELGEPIMLGHVAASGGKPLAKAGLSEGTLEVHAMAAAAGCPVGELKAILAFAADGSPMVEVQAP